VAAGPHAKKIVERMIFEEMRGKVFVFFYAYAAVFLSLIIVSDVITIKVR